MRTGMLLVVLLVVGAGAWLALREDGPRDPGASAAGQRAPDAAPPPALRAAGRADADAPPPAPGEEPAPASAAASAPRRFVDGRLRGLDPLVTGAATITVRGMTARHEVPAAQPTVVAQADGTFQVEVTGVFAEGGQVTDLEIAVDHPGYVPALRRVPVPPAAAAGEDVHYRVDLEMVRAGFLLGRVETPRGDPAEAPVAAFAFQDGAPLPGERAVGRSGADGRYRLRIPRAGRYLVVAGGGAQGAPAFAEVGAAPGVETSVPALVLEAGLQVSGTATRGGAPLGGAEIEAVPVLPEGRWLHYEGVRAVWADGRVVNGKARTTADEQGHFVVPGLGAGPCRIRVADVADLVMHMSCGAASERVVEVPAVGVVLELDACAVTLALDTQDRAVPGLSFTVAADGGVVAGTPSGDEEFEILLPHGAHVLVQVAGDDLEQQTFEFEVPSEGAEHRQVLGLRPPVRRAALVVTLVAPGGAAVAFAGFGFYAPGATDAFAGDRRDVEAEDGAFRVEGVEAGSYVLKIRPGGPWWGGHGFYREETVRVDVPAAGEVPLRVVLRPAGRLRVLARDPDGRAVSAACVLRDARGEVVPTTYVTRTPGGLGASLGRLGGEGISDVEPALAAGTYELEVTHARFLPRTVRAEVVAGEIRDVEVVLQPTR